ncbi:MAG: 30S ribosomal protein S7 [Ignavibacteria bacterium]|nr:30S ribosomal protein S7 [Ignavibacteria bacterium]MBL7992246.1 30S ribosomal protein S7 [Candidatus Kapabacteria bacterium]
MRKARAKRFPTPADPKYKDVIITRFINSIMYDGKKLTAQKIMYGALDIIREKTGQDELEFFRKAMANAAPAVEVRARRVGGATYQVPSEVPEARRVALAIRWLKGAARQRRDKSMAQRLANELTAAANGEGSAIKKRDDMHRMADANKAFAHFKW